MGGVITKIGIPHIATIRLREKTMQNLTALLKEQFAKSAEFEAEIKKNLGGLGYE